MTDRLREGIGHLLGEEWPSADVLDMLEREAEARKTPEDEPDALSATVARYLKRKDNEGRAHMGLLPNQEEE
jgi:hypothetical protein